MPPLNTHLLGEDVHNDKDDNREEHGVVLDLVDLEDDELLIEKRAVHVIVQRIFQLTTLIEGREDGTIVINLKMNPILLHDLGNTLDGILVERVEVKLSDLQGLALLLHTLNLTIDLLQELALDNLRGKTLELVAGSGLLTISGGSVIDDSL